MATHKKSVRYGALAAAAMILAVIGLWPVAQPKDQWWLAPPSAWAQQIDQALAAVKGITCRVQTIHISKDGSRHTSATREKFYSSSDSYRRDIYDGATLRETQWYTPDGDRMIQTSVRYDLRSYSRCPHPFSYGQQDPVERMRRSAAQLLNSGYRALPAEVIDGRTCVGFEIQAPVQNSPARHIGRVWYDTATRLPVREEYETPVQGRADVVATLRIMDQYEWNPALTDDTFRPQIPGGFTEAHPDDVQAARNPQAAVRSGARAAAVAFWSLIVAGQDQEAAQMATPEYAPRVSQLQRLREQADLSLARVEEVYAGDTDAFALTGFVPMKQDGVQAALGFHLVRQLDGQWQVRQVRMIPDVRQRQNLIDRFRREKQAALIEDVEKSR